MNAARRAIRGLRSRAASVRLGSERTILSGLSHNEPFHGGRILCYHSVGTPAWGVNDVQPARFRRHLELAIATGYRFVPAERIAATGGEPGELAVTFDDGLASVAANAAPVLDELGVPWTLFVVSAWADGAHSFGDGTILGWRDLYRLVERGARIGSHSVTHPNFRRLDRARTTDELQRSRRAIEDRLGISVDSFAIPFGRSGDWTSEAASAARRAGYTTVYAQSEDRRPAGTVPRTFITRFDDDRVFRAALRGAFDGWEEWT